MKSTIKDITFTGIGIALFVALSMCLRVPVFENYYLCLGYIVMTVYCYSYRISSGIIVGTLGTIIYCVLIGGLRGMPGWAIGNIVLGLIIGYIFRLTKKLKKPMIEIVICIIGIIIATAVSILGVKSIVECVLYAQPFLVRVITNMYAFIADAFVICISIPICRLLEPHVKRLV